MIRIVGAPPRARSAAAADRLLHGHTARAWSPAAIVLACGGGLLQNTQRRAPTLHCRSAPQGAKRSGSRQAASWPHRKSMVARWGGLLQKTQRCAPTLHRRSGQWPRSAAAAARLLRRVTLKSASLWLSRSANTRSRRRKAPARVSAGKARYYPRRQARYSPRTS